jgi:hypothetical protein
LRQHLESNGARFLHIADLHKSSSDDLRRGFLVIQHDAEPDLARLPEPAGSLMEFVTNWWVERCLYGKRLVDPAEDVLSRPLGKLSTSGKFAPHNFGFVALTSLGFSGLTINSTGFAGIELLHVTKVVTLMGTGITSVPEKRSDNLTGATYDEQLSAKTSVIVCNPPTVNSPKLKFAADKRIPAVHVTWLWECVRSGRLQPYGEYQLHRPSSPQPQKLRQKQSVTDRPDAAGPEEGNAKLRQKNVQAAKIVTKPLRQQLPGRPGTLDLAASTTELRDANHDTDQLTYDQDEPTINSYDGAASFPLQETNANSPHRPSASATSARPLSRHRSSSAESLIRFGKPNPQRTPTPDSVVPAAHDSVIPAEDTELAVTLGIEAQTAKPEEEKDYSDILAQLRANRKTAPTSADQAEDKRRKRRQLGRATSTRSNQSAGGDSSGNLLDEEGETVVLDEYQPSQELGWDSPGAAKAREQMIKKLGGTVKEKSVPVQEIGIVKDVAAETVGRRKRRG